MASMTHNISLFAWLLTRLMIYAKTSLTPLTNQLPTLLFSFAPKIQSKLDWVWGQKNRDLGTHKKGNSRDRGPRCLWAWSYNAECISQKGSIWGSWRLELLLPHGGSFWHEAFGSIHLSTSWQSLGFEEVSNHPQAVPQVQYIDAQ